MKLHIVSLSSIDLRLGLLGLGWLALLMLSGCQTAPVVAPSAQEKPPTSASPGGVKVPSRPLPPILSVSRVDGKGIPNGRSEGIYSRGFHVLQLNAAKDPEYGRVAEKAIQTGPLAEGLHIMFLNSLRGPNNEPVSYERLGACCEFQDKSLPMGGGLLDIYTIKIDGSNEIIHLFIESYRRSSMQIPVGFTQRKGPN